MGARKKEDRKQRGKGRQYKRQPDALIPKEVLIADGIIDPKKTKKRSRTAKRLAKEAREAAKQAKMAKLEETEVKQEEEQEQIEEEPENDVEVEDAVATATKTKLDLLEDEAPSEDENLHDDEMDLENASDGSEEIDADLAEEMVGEAGSDSEDGEEGDGDEEDEETDHFAKMKKKSDRRKQGILDKLKTDEEQEEVEIATLDVLPSKADLENNNMVDVDILLERIQRNIATLKNFSKYRNETNSRSEYLNVLIADLCSYYNYNEFLMTEFLQLLPLDEITDFLDANEKPRPTTIRTNTLKARRRELAQNLIARSVNLDPLDKWSNTGLEVHDSTVPIGATPEYLCGHYMLQGASSQLPVISLAPKPGDRVLDCSAAPGGKTTHMAAMMRNSGLLVANDANKDRLKSCIANLHRLSCCNTVVSHQDGRDLAKTWPLFFNKVLLDAPCSGTGVISKDPQVKLNKSENDIKKCACLQKEMILSAIDCLNANTPGGAFLMYCTCSLMVAENEAVVDYILRKRNVKVVDSGLTFGEPGFTKFENKKFDPSVAMSRRFYPHKHNMDGFFVCKIQKLANGEKLDKDELSRTMAKTERKIKVQDKKEKKLKMKDAQETKKKEEVVNKEGGKKKGKDKSQKKAKTDKAAKKPAQKRKNEGKNKPKNAASKKPKKPEEKKSEE